MKMLGAGAAWIKRKINVPALWQTMFRLVNCVAEGSMMSLWKASKFEAVAKELQENHFEAVASDTDVVVKIKADEARKSLEALFEVTEARRREI